MDSLKKLDSPLDIYGFIRKNEQLCYVLGISDNLLHLPRIGQLSMDGLVQDNLKLLGIFLKGDLQFYYRQKNGWQKIEHCVIDQNDSFKRTPFPEKLMRVLANACVVLIGVGSMGSRLALGLTRSGIRNFKLCDPDILNIENISRHEGTLYDLMRFKVVSVRERMLRVNPYVQIKTYRYDIFKRDKYFMDKFFKDVSLVIATTDKTSVQLKTNRECWRRKIPALFAGCYDEARGGEVLYTLPGKTKLCLECLRGGVRGPERRGEYDYTGQTGKYIGEPGLNAAINLIADATEQYAIALLLRKQDCELAKLIDPKKNLLFIGGALGENFYYLKDSQCFKRPFQFIYPDLNGPWKDCSTCQQHPNTSVRVGENKQEN